MSANMWKEVDKPRSFASWLWLEGVLDFEIEQPAILDHKELVGKAMGRTRLLQAL